MKIIITMIGIVAIPTANIKFLNIISTISINQSGLKSFICKINPSRLQLVDIHLLPFFGVKVYKFGLYFSASSWISSIE